jgi:hypothetical protein
MVFPSITLRVGIWCTQPKRESLQRCNSPIVATTRYLHSGLSADDLVIVLLICEAEALVLAPVFPADPFAE